MEQPDFLTKYGPAVHTAKQVELFTNEIVKPASDTMRADPTIEIGEGLWRVGDYAEAAGETVRVAAIYDGRNNTCELSIEWEGDAKMASELSPTTSHPEDSWKVPPMSELWKGSKRLGVEGALSPTRNVFPILHKYWLFDLDPGVEETGLIGQTLTAGYGLHMESTGIYSLPIDMNDPEAAIMPRTGEQTSCRRSVPGLNRLELEQYTTGLRNDELEIILGMLVNNGLIGLARVEQCNRGLLEM